MKGIRKKIVLIIVISCVAVAVSFWFVSGKWIAKGLEDQADGTNEYAIVLGAKVKKDGPSLSLRYRLESALAYANEYPHVRLILSGGQGIDEPMSEAMAMKNYLIENGISEERLLLEEDSTSTFQNLQNSKKLLPSDVSQVTIITSDFHLARARLIAERLGFQTDAIGAKTPKVVEVKSNARERLALLKTYFFDR